MGNICQEFYLKLDLDVYIEPEQIDKVGKFLHCHYRFNFGGLIKVVRQVLIEDFA